MNKHLAVTQLTTALIVLFTSNGAWAQPKLPLPKIPQPQSKSTQKWDSTQSPSRMIFLNGVNIGNVRDQELQNVTIRIDSAGNISIVAPQYDVSRETSYHPLLPAELPRFPKSQAQYPGIPESRYSRVPGNEALLPASAQPTPFQDLRNSHATGGLAAQTRAQETRAELNTAVPPDSTATFPQETTPVSASQKLPVPPVSTPDLPSDARGERL